MPHLEESTTLNVPIEEAFTWVSDPDHLPRWVGPFEEMTIEGEPREGAPIKVKAKFLGVSFTNQSVVTGYEPPRRFSWRGERPFPIDTTATLERTGENTTEVTISADLEPGGFFKLASGFVAEQMRKSLRDDVVRLKEIVDGT